MKIPEAGLPSFPAAKERRSLPCRLRTDARSDQSPSPHALISGKSTRAHEGVHTHET